jgi:hypothetical protein
LNHIEFSVKNGALIATQRNIYTGFVAPVTKETEREEWNSPTGNLKDCEPIGMRTNDFLALYSFTDVVSFYFVDKNHVWFESRDRRTLFRGIVDPVLRHAVDQIPVGDWL